MGLTKTKTLAIAAELKETIDSFTEAAIETGIAFGNALISAAARHSVTPAALEKALVKWTAYSYRHQSGINFAIAEYLEK